MAFSSFLISFLLFLSINPILPSPLIDELNQPPPPDFDSTVANNCQRDPSIRYCNATADISNIFKSTVIARHLCFVSRNPDCNLAFSTVDLHSQPKLAPLYLSFSFFWKYCPLSIQSIDLSNNSLKGPFPSDILQCTQIQSLDLRRNELVGKLPFDRFTLLTNLLFLNLSYNEFSDASVDGVWLFKRFNSSSFLHSGLINHHRGFKATTTILSLVGVLGMFVSIVGCFGWVCVRRPDLLPAILRKGGHRFTPAMLKKATNGFSEKNLLLKGERVEIYGGVLRDGHEVEVNIQRGKFSSEDRRGFDEECRVLVELSHKNLVKVMGWCDQREFRAIVTERIGLCSVKEWLLRSPLWRQRLKIFNGVVEGMLYLQDQWPHVGYDLQTSNVMLSVDGEPLISKFKIRNHNSEAKNVYKFGLFLLELVTNKRPRETFERGESEFIKWVNIHHPVNTSVVIDERMKLTNTTYEQVKKAVGIGLACAGLSADRLLTISEISIMLGRVSSPSRLKTMPTMGLHKERKHNQ